MATRISTPSGATLTYMACRSWRDSTLQDLDVTQQTLKQAQNCSEKRKMIMFFIFSLVQITLLILLEAMFMRCVYEVCSFQSHM